MSADTDSLAAGASAEHLVEMEHYQETDTLKSNATGEVKRDDSDDDDDNNDNNSNNDISNDHINDKPFWFRGIEKTFQSPTGKYIVASSWMIIFILALIFGWELFSHTQFSVHAPRSSKAGKARHKINQEFEDETRRYYAIFYWTCDHKQCVNPNTGENTDITDDSLYLSNMTNWLRDKLEVYNQSNSEHQLYNITDYYNSLRICRDYTDDTETEERQLCEQGTYDFFISGINNQSSIMVVESKKSATDDQKLDLADFLENRASDLNSEWHKQTGIRCKATGNLVLWVDMQEETKRSVDRNMLFTPLMFALVAYVVHSPRLMLLSIVNVFVALLVSFLLIYPFTYVIDISTMQPPIYTALVVALALDYSIFLLTRFHAELEAELGISIGPSHNNNNNDGNNEDENDNRDEISERVVKYEQILKSVLSAVRWSGGVIRVSGFILFLAFVIFLFSSLDFLRSFGLGCAICVVVDAAVALTLLPALLLIWPEFFCVWGFCGWMKVEYPAEVDPNADDDSDIDDNDNDNDNDRTELLKSTDDAVKDAGNNEQTIETPLISGDAGDTTTTTATGSTLSVESAAAAGQGDSTDNNHSYQKAAPTLSTLEAIGLSAADRNSYDTLLTENQVRRYNEGMYTDEELKEVLKDVSRSEESWLRFTSTITEYPKNLWVICLVYLLILPISVLLFYLNIEYGENLIFPRDSEGYETWKQQVRREYSAGFVSPFNILVKVNERLYGENATVWDYTYMNDTSRIMYELYTRVYKTDAQLDMIDGVSVVGDEYFYTVDQSVYENRIYTSQLYHAEVDAFVGDSLKTSLFQLSSHKDPTASHLKEITTKLRSKMKDVCHEMGRYKCYLHGNTVEFSDTVASVYENYPALLISTIFVVLGYAAWTYGSAFLAFRLAITLVLPLAFIWGIVVLVYGYGMLDWMKWASIHSCGGAMWLTPVMANSILLGLSLDYECFLYSRIYEYTTVLGMSMRTAVINAVMKTGDTITHAGVLMCMSFFGLLFGTNKGVNQMGVIIIVGVLVDTFIIRTILVPAILSVDFKKVAVDMGLMKHTEPALVSSDKE